MNLFKSSFVCFPMPLILRETEDVKQSGPDSAAQGWQRRHALHSSGAAVNADGPAGRKHGFDLPSGLATAQIPINNSFKENPSCKKIT